MVIKVNDAEPVFPVGTEEAQRHFVETSVVVRGKSGSRPHILLSFPNEFVS